MATSINGLPVPEDSDPIGDGAKAIRDLAAALGVLFGKAMRSGTTNVPTNSGGGGTATVTFDPPLPGIPVVALTVATGAGNANTAIVRATSATTSGFVIAMGSGPSNGTTPVGWIAHVA